MIDSRFLFSIAHDGDSSQYSILSTYLINLPSAIHSLVDESPTQLPDNYQPTEYDVVCGRGKGSYNRVGNKRFRSIVATFMYEYESSKSKMDKSLIIGRIVDRVREQDNGKAHFLKYNTKSKCWFVLNNEQAREKVGHAIREVVTSSRQKLIAGVRDQQFRQ